MAVAVGGCLQLTDQDQPHVDLWTDNVHLNDTLFGTMADVGLREHETWVAEREGTIAGVAVWAAPGKQFVEE